MKGEKKKVIEEQVDKAKARRELINKKREYMRRYYERKKKGSIISKAVPSSESLYGPVIVKLNDEKRSMRSRHALEILEVDQAIAALTRLMTRNRLILNRLAKARVRG